MRLRLIASLGEAAQAAEYAGRNAVVIDTLRATSNMAAALACGAKEIVPVRSAEEAQALYRPGDIRGGEWGGRPIPGFELGNSPEEYERPELAGKRIIMTTTNGTRAICAAASASRLLAASLLNARACAEAAAVEGRDVLLLCSGSRNAFCLEDGLAAGAVLAELDHLASCEWDDGSRAMLGLYQANREHLEEALLGCDSGVRLVRLGFAADVRHCARLNLYRAVPCLTPQGVLVPWTAAPP